MYLDTDNVNRVFDCDVSNIAACEVSNIAASEMSNIATCKVSNIVSCEANGLNCESSNINISIGYAIDPNTKLNEIVEMEHTEEQLGTSN